MKKILIQSLERSRPTWKALPGYISDTFKYILAFPGLVHGLEPRFMINNDLYF